MRIEADVIQSVAGSRFRCGWRTALVAGLLATLGWPASSAAQPVYIFVTTLEQKISSTGGCSLQEAIFSANLASNTAITGYDHITNAAQFVTTQCVPGGAENIIVLPTGGVFQIGNSVEDASNPFGPTATPLITSNITIEGYGATLQHVSASSPPIVLPFHLFAVGSTGNLTIRNVYINGFVAVGGDGGARGGGGGAGAGGAIFVHAGGLVVENTTFDGNGAIGGNGAASSPDLPSGVLGGGGGGGLGGLGGKVFGVVNGFGAVLAGGAGGGGSIGSGGAGLCTTDNFTCGGGGGGTVFSGGAPFIDSPGDTTSPGFACGGAGGQAGNLTQSGGADAPCPGGGGGGGGESVFQTGSSDGGAGNYGGGGGGGSSNGGHGGNGGFGGGGGAGWTGNFGGNRGGTGGFGGGGGSAANGTISGTGHPGLGGMFGGDANSLNGGGGAGLGGAIFNDSGSVAVSNSTFTNNFATRGTGGSAGAPGAADNGADAGAAIFSRNGSLNVTDVTISGNQGTGSGAGIGVVGDNATANFTLDDTIIANNGAEECFLRGTVTTTGAGNLIGNNGSGGPFFAPCPGVVSSGDPMLGLLQNNGGLTPTMAIPTSSPAWNAADSGTSLTVDQRGQMRPAMGGFDIGAFELCLLGRPPLQRPCPITGGVNITPPLPLTILISPPGTGTTTPAAGTTDEPDNTVVIVSAMGNPGYLFSSWTGNVTNPGNASSTVIMNQAQTITANFVPCNCVTDVSGFVTVTRGGFVLNPITKRFAQTVTVTNASAATIAGPVSLVLDNLSINATLFNATGATDALEPPSGSPYIDANVSLAPGQMVVFSLQFTDPSLTAISYTTRVLAGPGPR